MAKKLAVPTDLGLSLVLIHLLCAACSYYRQNHNVLFSNANAAYIDTMHHHVTHRRHVAALVKGQVKVKAE